MGGERALIVAGSRDLVYELERDYGLVHSHYGYVRDAVWRFERAHFVADRIISGANGTVLMNDGSTRTSLPERSEGIYSIRGADLIGEWFARVHLRPVTRLAADWKTFGKAAGPFRNQRMVEMAAGLVVVRFPDSKGSRDVLEQARERGLPVEDVVIDRPVRLPPYRRGA